MKMPTSLPAPVPVLLERISQRGRAIESGITDDYLSLLASYYTDWMETFDLCPVLTIPSEHLDFVNKPHHLDIVVERIQDTLAGRKDVVFPNGE